MRRLVFLLGLALSLALAHHGWSEYDASKAFKATGTIREISYGNPHVTVRLEVPALGNTAAKTWTAVLAPPFRMEARGLPKEALKVGMTVAVEGYPHRSEASEMRAERITIGEKTVELR